MWYCVNGLITLCDYTEVKSVSITAKSSEIIRRRVERGWDKSCLARAAKVNHCLISRAEQGKSVSPATAKAIADALETSVFDLFELAGKGV